MHNGQRGQLLVLLIFLSGIGILGLTGCAHKAATVATPVQVQQNQQRLVTAQQFLTALQGVTPNQRETYVQVHPTEARVAFQTEDPAIRSQLLQAMNDK